MISAPEIALYVAILLACGLLLISAAVVSFRQFGKSSFVYPRFIGPALEYESPFLHLFRLLAATLLAAPLMFTLRNIQSLDGITRVFAATMALSIVFATVNGSLSVWSRENSARLTSESLRRGQWILATFASAMLLLFFAVSVNLWSDEPAVMWAAFYGLCLLTLVMLVFVLVKRSEVFSFSDRNHFRDLIKISILETILLTLSTLILNVLGSIFIAFALFRSPDSITGSTFIDLCVATFGLLLCVFGASVGGRKYSGRYDLGHKDPVIHRAQDWPSYVFPSLVTITLAAIVALLYSVESPLVVTSLLSFVCLGSLLVQKHRLLIHVPLDHPAYRDVERQSDVCMYVAFFGLLCWAMASASVVWKFQSVLLGRENVFFLMACLTWWLTSSLLWRLSGKEE